MKTHEGVNVLINVLLTWVLVGGQWSASHPSCSTPGEGAYSTHWIGGWVGPRAGFDDMEKRKFLALPGLKFQLTKEQFLILLHQVLSQVACYGFTPSF
jgi:hypothetical protein